MPFRVNPSRVALGIAIGLAASVFAFLSRPADINAATSLAALGVVWAGAIPGIIYLLAETRPPIPIFPIFGLFHAATFGFPVLLVDFIWPLSTPVAIGAAWTTPHVYRIYLSSRAELFDTQALMLSLAGLVVATAGYLFSERYLRSRLFTFRIVADGRERTLLVLLWILLIGHMAYVNVPAIQRLPSAPQLLGPLGYLSFGMFYLLWRERQIGAKHAVVLFLLFCLNLVGLAKGGLITPFALYILFFALLLIRRRNWKFLIVGLIAFLAIASAYQTISKFRSQVALAEAASDQHRTLGIADRLALLTSLYAHALTNPDAPTGVVTSARTAARRLSLIPVFSLVVDRTPSTVPFWDGKTYQPLFTSFIPRIIWPNKPEERSGRAFGLRYDLIAVEDLQTSVNLPWLIEAYANFGGAGVIVGMTLIGAFFALLERIFNRAEMSNLEWIVGLIVIFPLAYAESNFSLMCGSLLPLALALWIFFNVGLRRWRRRSERDSV